MEYVRLGASSLIVSRISLGAMGFGDKSWRSWVLDLEGSRSIFRRALEQGINLIDTCNYYSNGRSEEIVGALLKDVPRSEIVVATKAGNPMGPGPNARGYSRKHLFEAVDASLRRLGTDHIDIYQTHIWAPDTNVAEMMDAFDDLVRAGKVLYLGITDMPFWQFATAYFHAERHGRAKFVSVQNHYNLLWREDERELVPFSRAHGIGLIPYSPIARGFLCGPTRGTERAKTDDFTYKLYGRPADQAVTSAVATLAAKRGCSPAQVALAWILGQAGVTSPIVGATRVEHIDQAVAALSLTFTREEQHELEASYVPRPARV